METVADSGTGERRDGGRGSGVEPPLTVADSGTGKARCDGSGGLVGEHRLRARRQITAASSAAVARLDTWIWIGCDGLVRVGSGEAAMAAGWIGLGRVRAVMASSRVGCADCECAHASTISAISMPCCV